MLSFQVSCGLPRNLVITCPLARVVQGSTQLSLPGREDRSIPETCGKLLMVTDEETMLLKVVLSKVMETDSGRQYIVEKLGNSYLQIASELLKQMESS